LLCQLFSHQAAALEFDYSAFDFQNKAFAVVTLPESNTAPQAKLDAKTHDR
jgi:hypothetical protein